MALLGAEVFFCFDDRDWSIFMWARFFLCARIDGIRIDCSFIGEGTEFTDCEIMGSIVGIRICVIVVMI